MLSIQSLDNVESKIIYYTFISNYRNSSHSEIMNPILYCQIIILRPQDSQIHRPGQIPLLLATLMEKTDVPGYYS